ncbi:DNA repair protein RAD4 isoform X1 [Rosa rugosa]|uniref:DNA repair protein RAD4 isoform X1 n=1 Tax=Rosa rugosa TaxID=74645 RepID=UPI002B411D94|nr:DNA repair protein RAD4 isoform X1 [Rosa rugosa]
MRSTKESKRSKESAASASGTLGDISEEAVAKLVRRANRSGKKKCENQLHPCDLIGKQESGPQRDKKDVDATVGSNALETEACSRDALQKVSRDAKGDGESFQCSFTNSREELNDSDWEDGPVPISNSIGGHEVTIEINETPDSRRQKRSRRASVEDKELAELVHKAHLLCLIARGRLIDRACDDALIQASLLSLLPEHLLHISKVAKLTAKHLFPLVCWFQNNFRVRTTSVRRSFHSALNFALETREGTQEEIAALSVALLRALNLTTRLVSILNVASLKPEADKTDCSSEDASRLSKGIFSTSTPMVARRNEVPVSPATSSERNSVGETPQIGSYKSKDCHLTSSKTRCKVSYAYELNDKMSDTLACEEWNDMSEACHTKKSQESKRRGDLEFEMQLQMALSATAVPTAGIKIGSDNKDSHSNAAKRLKRTVCEESPISSQSISTAVGSRKEGSPLYWAEVYCNGENLTGKWLHIDAINAIIDGELKVEAVAAACKTPLRYVVAFAGNGAKDVTRRYCLKWYQIASQRVNPIWWDKVLAPLRDLEVRATGGMVYLEKEHTGSSSEHNKEIFLNNSGSEEMNYLPSNVNLNAKSSLEGSKETGKGLDVESSSRSFEIATRNSLEDMELETRALTEPLPTNQQAYKNHHLYAIEKWLTKHQVLHPKGPILGFCSGHPVYPRTCVQTLKTKHKWLREGLQVKPNERPVKELKRSIKLQKVQVLEDDDYVGDNSIGTIELYGKWQLEPLHLPHAINGKVPKNDHGNVEVWSEKCLPPGTVHLRLPRVFSVAKRLEIDYAPAMVDFEFKNGQSYPVFDGIVVCAEFKDAILEAYAEERDRREAVEKKRYEMQAISRWYQLLSSIVTRQRIQNRYGESSSTASAETENVHRKLDVQLGGGQNDEEGGLHENTPDDPTIELDNHEHVFLTENQSFDEDNLVVTKRCLCGFSVQVEEL